MKKFITLLVIIFVLGTTGCATKMNVLSKNGAKEPTYIYQAENISTSIVIQSYIAAMSKQNEKGYSYPENYLNINEPNKIYVIDKYIIGVLSSIRIINPYGIPYEIKIKYKTYRYKDKFPHVTSYVLYQGDEEEKILDYWRKIDYPKFLTTHEIIVSRKSMYL